MKYKLQDNEGGGLKKDTIFNSLQEIKEELQSFHSIDCDDTEKWSLIDCLEIGNWSITNAETGKEIDYNLINI